MKMLYFGLLTAACICLWLPTAIGNASAACILTGNVDTDFAGPGVVCRTGESLTPPYLLTAPPLSQPPAAAACAIPSGFHVSKVCVTYDCSTDTLCIGYDVSNQTLLNGVGTGIFSVAWDADGDGNPCAITNPCLALPGDLDLLLPGNDDLPKAGLVEKYQVLLDLNQDSTTDVILNAYIDGFGLGTDTFAKDFQGPCGGSSAAPPQVIHLRLQRASDGVSLYTLGADANLAYGQDIEFSIAGLAALAKAGSLVAPPCNVGLISFADSDLDASQEVSLNWGLFQFSCPVTAGVSCEKLIDGLPYPAASPLLITGFPTTVTYTLKATNTGDTPENIRITDPDLGVDQTFPCVAVGTSVQVQKQATFGAAYCDHADLVNTMTASADIGDCGPPCPSGTLTANCQSSAAVRFPASTRTSFTCDKTVNGQHGTPGNPVLIPSLPATLTYVVGATNTSASGNLDITISDTGLLAGAQCSLPLPAVFPNVAPGQTVSVMCTVELTATNCNQTLTNTATVTAVLSPGQTCVLPPDPSTCSASVTVRTPDCVGPTRTPGFWQTHPTLLAQQIANCPALFNFGACTGALNIKSADALMLDNIAKLRNGTKRSALGQARMQLVQQLVAAAANVCYFGTQPTGFTLANAVAALNGTNKQQILDYVGMVDGFNNSGDDITPPGFNPGSAAPQTARANALLSNITQGGCFL